MRTGKKRGFGEWGRVEEEEGEDGKYMVVYFNLCK